VADKTGIEWTEATWNPVVGCTHVSAGCDHCYAAREASGRLAAHPIYAGLADSAKFTGEVRLLPERLGQPLRWRKPRRIFVNSMSDLFHDGVPDEYIAKVFATMALAGHHTFQVLTKRHARMRSLLSNDRRMRDMVRWMVQDPQTPWPLPNVWLGVSVEDQHWADIRVPALLDTPATVRFLSCEPLLGPIDLFGDTEQPGPACTVQGYSQPTDYGTGTEYDLDVQPGVDWVIAGGESGPGARLMLAPWARALRDQCNAAGVAFLFKQWGEWAPTEAQSFGIITDPRERQGEPVHDPHHPDIPWRRVYRRVGKRAAGRELDGRTWDEYPEPA
jgi:protein gp37